jgi:phosphopantothenoylcysteine decarboxylase/phosphopantothenate--cysteine ligase
VVVVHDGPDLPWATVERVESATEMLDGVLAHADDADALVSAAAISDYTVAGSDEKIRSGQADLTLDLEPTPKLLDTVRAEHPDLPVVGFKTETAADDEQLREEARRIQDRAELAFVVANDASVMGAAETRALFVTDDESEVFEGSKDELGARVAERLATAIGGRQPE